MIVSKKKEKKSITISLDSELIEKMDAARKRASVTRSEVIRQALERILSEEKRK